MKNSQSDIKVSGLDGKKEEPNYMKGLKKDTVKKEKIAQKVKDHINSKLIAQQFEPTQTLLTSNHIEKILENVQKE